MAQAPNGSVVIHLGWYGTAVLTLISVKLLLSLLISPVSASKVPDKTLTRYKVAGIVTCRNEDPAVFARCLSSILASTRLPAALTVIDDGSTSTACTNIARTLSPAFRAVGVDYQIIVFPRTLASAQGSQLDSSVHGTRMFTYAWTLTRSCIRKRSLMLCGRSKSPRASNYRSCFRGESHSQYSHPVD